MRETRSGAGLETLWHDLRFGARLLRRNPLFTFTAVLSLALGIGATTTIFSLVNALLLRDVRVAAPRQLVEVWRTTQFGSGTAFSYPAYERLRDENTVFSGVLALSKNPMAGSTGSGSRAAGRFVSGNFFDVLGLTPLAGRLLSPRDDRPDAPEGSAVAVLSHRFWQREFGGSADALGQTIRIDAVPFTIVGVAPAGVRRSRRGQAGRFLHPDGQRAAGSAEQPAPQPAFQLAWHRRPVEAGRHERGRARPTWIRSSRGSWRTWPARRTGCRGAAAAPRAAPVRPIRQQWRVGSCGGISRGRCCC